MTPVQAAAPAAAPATTGLCGFCNTARTKIAETFSAAMGWLTATRFYQANPLVAKITFGLVIAAALVGIGYAIYKACVEDDGAGAPASAPGKGASAGVNPASRTGQPPVPGTRGTRGLETKSAQP